MKFKSPAYLLKTPDEGAAIELVSKDWQGGLPLTILFNAQGETIYSKQGKFKTDVLVADIEKILTVQNLEGPPSKTLMVGERLRMKRVRFLGGRARHQV